MKATSPTAGMSLKVVLLLVACTNCADVKLFPLGDSLTSCNRVSQNFSFAQLSYRECLWQEFLLPRFGPNGITFVGRKKGCNAKVDKSFPNSTGFPNAHDAYFGRTAFQILQELRSQETITPADVTLLLVGTNDFILNRRKQGRVVAHTIATIARLLPSRHVFIGVPLPIDFRKTKLKFSSKSRKRFEEYRNNITNYLETHVRNASVVRFEDFNATTETYDGIHPNKMGECSIARGWFSAIEGVLSKHLLKLR